MTFKAGPEDYEWLVSREARRWLDFAATNASALVAATKHLRQVLDPVRTHLVLEQAELRQRAKVKFSQADRMFFTRKLLEQATDEQVAAHKAARFADCDSAADLCCGIGGDLLALADVAATIVGVDKDPLAGLLAAENCVNTGRDAASVEVGDAADFDVASIDAWHIDPDRRAAGTRASDPAWCQPDVATIDRMLAANPHAAVKLAPAADAPETWSTACEREWIESRGECRQQVAWFGRLTEHHGRRRATVLDSAGEAVSFFADVSAAGVSAAEPPQANTVGRLLFEPAAAVLAAGLAGPLAAAAKLAPLLPGGGYLSGDSVADISPLLLSRFTILDVLPFDLRRLTTYLREQQLGVSEIKKRGVDVSPESLRTKLPREGAATATLILFPLAGHVQAVIARRMSTSESIRVQPEHGAAFGRDQAAAADGN